MGNYKIIEEGDHIVLNSIKNYDMLQKNVVYKVVFKGFNGFMPYLNLEGIKGNFSPYGFKKNG